MTGELHLSTAVKTDRLQAIVNRVDAAATPGHLKLYTAPQPADGADPGSAVLLADVTLADPCGVVTGNVLAMTLPPGALVALDGDVAWGRMTDGDGNWVGDGGAGAIGSGAFIQAANLHPYGGGLVGFVTATITE